MSGGRPIDGYVDPNFPNPGGDGDAPIIIYGYTPSFVVGILGVVLFFISLCLHSFQLFKYRTWYFIPVAFGCAMEIVGYAFRILSGKVDPYLVIYFVIQYFFIVVAPVLFAAGIYTILSKMINMAGRQYSPILPPKAILGLFITCDVIATIVQVAGAAMIGVAESNRKDPTMANNILLGGLAFQVFTFFIFLVLLSIFLVRAKKIAFGHLRLFTVSLIVASLAVYLRTCFRLAETAQGLQESLSSHEVYFGCLEFAPIVVAVVLFNIWHPGKWLPSSKRRQGDVVMT